MREHLYKLPKKITKAESSKSKMEKELVKVIKAEFEDRKYKRRSQELQWRLNLDFYQGRQNNLLTNFDTVATIGKQYAWQKNDSFNHIAPIIEGRMARVMAATEEGEISASLREQAIMWSEVCGTAFYKVWWNPNGGRTVGVIQSDGGEEKITEGDVQVSVVSPFEIYPDNMVAGDVPEVSNIIHARGEVIEWYERPSAKYPNGRLVIIEGEKISHDAELPFVNEINGVRGLPFVRQTSEAMVGQFFGRSVVERAIAVQRAYNTVKNRKVEFLNRMACGVLAVEEGSVDIEALETDGLAPGKIIVYRNGTTPPKFMDVGTLPSELEREEERLLAEFELISGSGEITRSAGGHVSGVALGLLAEQDRIRMTRTVESARRACAKVVEQRNYIVNQFKGEIQ
ncbi:MAG: hypothetical protein FWE38_04105 [Firmicutes bacterium]|nr:hypothetical protein [Bacillota bacterium]